MGDPFVLVVEDNADIREVLRDYLGDEGFRVVTAEHGLRALELLNREGTPCLVVLDLMMPVMDGWELRERLREHPNWADVPVAVLSAAVRRPEGLEELDVVAVMPKPIDWNRLRDLVATYCRPVLS